MHIMSINWRSDDGWPQLLHVIINRVRRRGPEERGEVRVQEDKSHQGGNLVNEENSERKGRTRLDLSAHMGAT